jgi:hypothetical protein
MKVAGAEGESAIPVKVSCRQLQKSARHPGNWQLL